MNPQICPTCHAPIPPQAPGGFCLACLLRDAEEVPATGRAAPPLVAIAAAFPQFEVVRLIGQGGMGFVYQVRQPGLDRTVALKILSPELGRDPAFAERFAREARVLGKLNHPNIVTVFEHGESGGFFYLLMEYVDGVNLRQAMRAGRFTPEQALAIVPPICDALQAAHAQGVWHRDIKPENILLDARGGVKIADFGIARIVGDPQRDFTLTLTGGVLGSAAYMAPEQHETPRNVDHRADIYSLGVVIYEMLTGELPLGRFPAPSRRAAVNARIDEIVFRTLEKERELRQQSVEEVKTDVQGAAVHQSADSGKRVAGLPFPFLWATGLIAGGFLLHLMAMNLRLGHETMAIVISIIGRLGMGTGVVIAAFTTYLRTSSKWAARGSALTGIAVILVLGMGFLNHLMVLGLMAAVWAMWAVSSFGGKSSDKESGGGPTASSRRVAAGVHGKLTLALSLFVLALAGAPLFAAFVGGREVIALCGTLLVSALGLGFMSWREPLGKFVVIAATLMLLSGLGMIIHSQRIEQSLRSERAFDYQWSEATSQEATSQILKWELALSEMDAPTRNHALGPVVEVVLPEPSADAPFLMDFENGNLVSPHPELSELLKSGGSSYLAPERMEDWSHMTKSWYGWLQIQKVNVLVTMPDCDSIQLFATLPFPLACKFEDADSDGIVRTIREGMDKNQPWETLAKHFKERSFIPLHSQFGQPFAFIAPATYGATMGMVEVVGKSASPKRGVKIRYRLVKRLPDTPAEPMKTSLGADSPADAMKAVLDAALNRNPRIFQEGFSKSFKAQLGKDGETLDFGNFGNCHWISTTTLDETHAESVVEADDGSKRRFTFRMILEDGAWKVDALGSKP